MAKFPAFTETFPTSIGAAWGTAGPGGVTWVNDGAGSGHAALGHSTSGVTSLYAAATYDLTSSYAFAQVGFPLPGNGTFQDALEISDDPTSGTNRFRFYFNGAGALNFVLVTDGAEVVSIATTYDPDDHRFLRFREDGGSIYWDTSPDGTTGSWTEQYTWSTPAWASGLTVAYLRGRAYRYGAEDTAAAMTVDNVNVGPVRPQIHVTRQAAGRAASW